MGEKPGENRHVSLEAVSRSPQTSKPSRFPYAPPGRAASITHTEERTHAPLGDAAGVAARVQLVHFFDGLRRMNARREAGQRLAYRRRLFRVIRRLLLNAPPAPHKPHSAHSLLSSRAARAGPRECAIRWLRVREYTSAAGVPICPGQQQQRLFTQHG